MARQWLITTGLDDLAVGSLGDLNGDGINDLAVGPWADGAAGATGALYLLMMNAFDPSGSTDAVASTVKIASGTPRAPGPGRW